MPRTAPQVLVVDLNNFARYPTVAVGYLIAEMRNHQFAVDLFSPLAIGVEGVTREPQVRPWSLIDERLRYRTAVSNHPIVRSIRKTLAERRRPSNSDNTRKIVEHLERALDERPPDVILISAYLMYFDLCEAIGRVAAARGIPVVLGGAYFNQPSVAEAWLDLPGLTAIVGGEAEPIIGGLVRSIVDGDRLTGTPGVWIPGEASPPPAPPLRNLDSLAFPDFSDFPWDRYANRIVPVITGRGCGWGACSFCSDVTSAMGRTFRSRSPENVLSELETQAKRCETARFIFVDLKLNSDLPLWNGLIDELPQRIPNAEWAASVHVNADGDSGLDQERLNSARRAGLVRVTTGLESGSQRVLDDMKKGTSVETTAAFLKRASEADISVRTTMIIGYPSETAEDLDLTTRFLNTHGGLIERVSLNRLAIIAGTPLDRHIQARPELYPNFDDYEVDEKMAAISHVNRVNHDRGHRRAVERVLAAVHEINRRPLRSGARAFEGVM